MMMQPAGLRRCLSFASRYQSRVQNCLSGQSDALCCGGSLRARLQLGGLPPAPLGVGPALGKQMDEVESFPAAVWHCMV